MGGVKVLVMPPTRHQIMIVRYIVIFTCPFLKLKSFWITKFSLSHSEISVLIKLAGGRPVLHISVMLVLRVYSFVQKIQL